MLIEVDKLKLVTKTSKINKSCTPINSLNNEVGEKENYYKNIYGDLKLWITLIFILFLNFSVMKAQNFFLSEQLKFSRVRLAYNEKASFLEKEFKEKNLSFPPKAIYIRSFKSESDLEIWVEEGATFVLFKIYKVCAKSGDLGPKIEQGDKQVPEGFYHIDRFNPMSKFYLSLGINYPNNVDLWRSGFVNPGGDIFIHGDCVTIGCLPMTDEVIKEIYVLAVLAKTNGQENIPVHIFPYRFSPLSNTLYRSFGKYLTFWDNLQEEYEYFDEHKKLRKMTQSHFGKYIFK